MKRHNKLEQMAKRAKLNKQSEFRKILRKQGFICIVDLDIRVILALLFENLEAHIFRHKFHWLCNWVCLNSWWKLEK